MKDLIITLHEKYKPKNLLNKLYEKFKIKYAFIVPTLISALFSIFGYIKNLGNPHDLPFSILLFILLSGGSIIFSMILTIFVEVNVSKQEEKGSDNLFNYLKENKLFLHDELMKLKLIGYQNLTEDYILDDNSLNDTLKEIDNDEIDEDWIKTISSTIINNKDYYLKEYEKYLDLTQEQSVDEIKKHIATILYKKSELHNKKEQLINQYVKGQDNNNLKKSKTLTLNL